MRILRAACYDLCKTVMEDIGYERYGINLTITKSCCLRHVVIATETILHDFMYVLRLDGLFRLIAYKLANNLNVSITVMQL
jgi:hypothetical protein